MKRATSLLVTAVGILLALGLVMLYSSGMRPGAAATGARFLLMQLVWCGIGLASCALAAWMDYRQLKKVSWVLYGASLVALILVLIPGIGVYINGARRWFYLGIGHFQPSEAAKLALIIMLAWYGDRYQHLMPSFWRGLVWPGCLIGAFLVLIFVEPDRGATLLLAAVSGIMLLAAGVRWRCILPPALLGAGGFVYALLIDPVRLRRIVSWLDPESHRQGAGWQAWQATLALGSGGWTGLGLGNGRQKFGFVPEHHTDFIYSIIGEELGLIATCSVIVLFMVVLFCGVYISWNASDTFGFLLGTGITFLIGLQTFINMGVVTSLLPNKGLPLPFISYGGSNLLLMLTCVGLLFSIARHSTVRAGEFEEEYESQETLATQSP